MSYRGPDWLRGTVEYFWGDEMTIFHRVVRVKLIRAPGDNVALFKRFKHLDYVSFPSAKQHTPESVRDYFAPSLQPQQLGGNIVVSTGNQKNESMQAFQ